MSQIILTPYNGIFLGPIARVLGWVMNGIYWCLSKIGIENIGLAIIVLTIVIYTCMLPLTIKQQKFSVLQRVMAPEIQQIQKKYEGKKDQDSQMKMTEEMQAVYDKYGVSQVGSCLQLIIQMPILFALYRVIYNVPAYVTSVKNIFKPLVDGIMATSGYAGKMESIVSSLNLVIGNADFRGSNASNYIIDALYAMNVAGWDTVRSSFPSLADTISSVQTHLNHLNSFLGLNISNSPMHIIQTSFKAGSYLMIVAACLIPLFSYLSQVLNIKLMPQQDTDPNDAMARQMKMMNRIMPLFSLVMCFTVPVGLGIYWTASSLARSVQQVLINKHLEKLDLDAVIEKNKEKAEKKAEKRREKMGVYQNQIYQAASMSTKRETHLDDSMSSAEKNEKVQHAYESAAKARVSNPNSLTAKANLVKEFNERNNK